MSALNETAPNPPEKYIFKCERHAAAAFEQLLSFYQEKEFFDTVLVAGNDRIETQAHTLVLFSLSEYFLEIFRNNPKASNANNVVELKEIEPTTLKPIIDFLYSGWIELSLETAEGFLRAATFLKIKTLVEGCNDFILNQLTLSNCFHWYRLANELALPGLKQISLNFTYNNFELVSKEKEILLLNEVDIQNVLFNDNPHGDFEEDVFRSLVAWIAYDKVKREHLLFQMLSMVRFQYLTPKFIIKNRKSVCKSAETYELICSWLEWHLLPETRLLDQQNCDLKPRRADEDKIAVIYSTNDKEDCVGIQTYDSKVDSWSLIKEIPLIDRKTSYGMIVVDEKLIVVGGFIGGIQTNRVECLDLQTCLWTFMPPKNTARTSCTVTSSNGYLCVSGGSTMEIYNFSTWKWNKVQYPSQTSGYQNTVFHSGIVHTLDFYRGLFQSYDVASNKWTSKAIQKHELHSFGLAVVDKFLYVIGGYSNMTYCSVATVMRYDLFNDTWCLMAPLKAPKHFSLNTLVLKNKIVLISTQNSIEEFNIDTNTWTTCECPSLPPLYYRHCLFSSKFLKLTDIV